MSVDTAPAIKLFEDFKAAVAKDDVSNSQRLLSALKLELTKFPALPPLLEESSNAQQQLLLARDILEHAILASVRQGDDSALDRNFAQLLPYYTDVRVALPPSQKEPLLQGLHLLALLVQNRIAEFHTALERLTDEVLSTPEVAQVCDFEAWLMEGSYNRLLTARSSPASPYYIPLLERLASTVQDELASCSEAAYSSLPVEYAIRILRLNGQEDLKAYATSRGWEVRDGLLYFPPKSEVKPGSGGGVRKENGIVGSSGEDLMMERNGIEAESDHAAEIIEHCMDYTKELERIV